MTYRGRVSCNCWENDKIGGVDRKYPICGIGAAPSRRGPESSAWAASGCQAAERRAVWAGMAGGLLGFRRRLLGEVACRTAL